LENWVERTTSRKNKVVLQGEGRGKFSSPPSVKLLGTKTLSKWGGVIWIGSLYYFSYISILYGWKELEE
jgi:hypothetical protein